MDQKQSDREARVPEEGFGWSELLMRVEEKRKESVYQQSWHTAGRQHFTQPPHRFCDWDNIQVRVAKYQ